jgi:hypothetical protein
MALGDQVEQWAVFIVKDGEIVAEKKSHGNTVKVKPENRS